MAGVLLQMGYSRCAARASACVRHVKQWVALPSCDAALGGTAGPHLVRLVGVVSSRVAMRSGFT